MEFISKEMFEHKMGMMEDFLKRYHDFTMLYYEEDPHPIYAGVLDAIENALHVLKVAKKLPGQKLGHITRR